MNEMKNIRESGLLERYLLGELSPLEERQIQDQLEADSSLMNHFQTLEANFEQIAQENAIQPPAELKDTILKVATVNEVNTHETNSGSALKSYLAIAASLALLFGVSSFWLYSQINTMEEDLRLVQEEKLQLKSNYERLESDLAETSKWYTLVNHPDTEKFILKGNDQSPNATAISYVNHKSKSVVLNAKGLPTLDNDHDYQLWADVEGVMIDMGVIPKNSEMIAMNYIPNSESLNITIEPAGGNDHPTVERLISNIYL